MHNRQNFSAFGGSLFRPISPPRRRPRALSGGAPLRIALTIADNGPGGRPCRTTRSPACAPKRDRAIRELEAAIAERDRAVADYNFILEFGQTLGVEVRSRYGAEAFEPGSELYALVAMTAIAGVREGRRVH